MKYIIPTLKRATIIKNRTLALLKRHGVKPKNKYIFLGLTPCRFSITKAAWC